MNTIRIIIADPQYLTRAGFVQLFGSHPSIKVLAEANDSEELMAEVGKHKPDLVVLDYHKLEHFSLEDIAVLRKAYPGTRVLLVTDDDKKANIFSALSAGVSSILTKNCSRDEIINAVQATAKGEKFFCNKVLDILLEKHLDISEDGEDCAPSCLSARELEIVALIAQGVPTKGIADKLCLSTHTVYTHRKNIMKKLQINSATEMVMYAVNMGIVKTGE